jgi:ABC-type Na+ efflux pump permease subunit
VWLILLHSHLHFGNVVATLAFSLLLVAVISGGIVTWASRTSSSPSAPAGQQEARSVPVTRLDVRRERLVLLHIAVTVGMITFSLFHILAILYY